MLDTQIAQSNATEGDACDCSGNGQCVEDRCLCNEGYILSDCSMSQEEFDEIQKLKQTILKELESSLATIGSDANREISLNVVSGVAQNTESSSSETMQ